MTTETARANLDAAQEAVYTAHANCLETRLTALDAEEACALAAHALEVAEARERRRQTAETVRTEGEPK